MSFCHCHAISQVKANCPGRGMSSRASAQPQGSATSSPHSSPALSNDLPITSLPAAWGSLSTGAGGKRSQRLI